MVNDRWETSFLVTALGRYRYTVAAWVDPFETWRSPLSSARGSCVRPPAAHLPPTPRVSGTGRRIFPPPGVIPNEPMSLRSRASSPRP